LMAVDETPEVRCCRLNIEITSVVVPKPAGETSVIRTPARCCRAPWPDLAFRLPGDPCPGKPPDPVASTRSTSLLTAQLRSNFLLSSTETSTGGRQVNAVVRQLDSSEWLVANANDFPQNHRHKRGSPRTEGSVRYC